MSNEVGYRCFEVLLSKSNQKILLNLSKIGRIFGKKRTKKAC